MRVTPTLEVERSLFARGARVVVGLDEVGRGAWAGPVSVGAVAITASCGEAPTTVRDSKALSAAARRRCVPLIDEWATAKAVGHASPAECDELGMRAGVALAASRAIEGLGVLPDALIVDGPLDLLDAPNAALHNAVAGHEWRRGPRPLVEALVKADQHCASVSAASVIAKVERDSILASWAESFPAFDLGQNAGYPSPAHQRALRGYGLTSIHRRSWRFVDSIPWMAGDATLRDPRHR